MHRKPSESSGQFARRAACSRSCAVRARQPLPDMKACEHCGGMFVREKRRSRESFRVRRFCSLTCNAAAKAPEVPAVRRCRQCGAEFGRRVGESAAKFARRELCSCRCASASRVSPEERARREAEPKPKPRPKPRPRPKATPKPRPAAKPKPAPKPVPVPAPVVERPIWRPAGWSPTPNIGRSAS